MSQEAGRAALSMLGGLGVSACLTLSTLEQIAAIEQTSSLMTPGDLVAVAVVALGAVLAAWHGATFAALLALHTLRGIRRRPLPHAQPAAAGAHRWATERRLRAGLLRWGFPLARRAILGAAISGAGAGLAALPAYAAAELGDDLGWGAITVEADSNSQGHAAAEPEAEPQSVPEVEQATPEVARAAPEDHAAPGSTRATHDVQPGENLWGIAAAHLGAHATDAEIAAAWPRWYEANRTRIGTDPDLIHPGLELEAPASHITEEKS